MTHRHRLLARGGSAAVRAPIAIRVQQRRCQHASLLSESCNILGPRQLLHAPGQILLAEGGMLIRRPSVAWFHCRRQLARRRLRVGRLLRGRCMRALALLRREGEGFGCFDDGDGLLLERFGVRSPPSSAASALPAPRFAAFFFWPRAFCPSLYAFISSS